MTIPAYPLAWPAGWKRTSSASRKNAKFRTGKGSFSGGSYQPAREVTISDGTKRVLQQILAFTPTGKPWVIFPDSVVISSDLLLRNDGLPRSGQREPSDPGVAVYWTTREGDTRCMAIDRYDRVADNLAAVAATLEAMRSIERHGGAEILNRAFTGFTAIEDQSKPWHMVLGVPAHASTDDVRTAYRRARAAAHPDRDGGDAELFGAVQAAWATFCKERGINE